jgi:pyruvate/2-oxoglutarate/acetoin dehydrogenase E1 component
VEKLKAFSLEHYKRATPVLWLEVSNSYAAHIEKSKSRYKMTKLIAERVAKSGHDITMLVPYNAQSQVLVAVIESEGGV